MIKYITLIAFAILSFGCKATTCLITEEDVVNNSKKYAQFVDIKLSKLGKLLNVVFTAPAEIEGKVLQNVLLHKVRSGKGQMEFTIPLKTHIENNKSSSWYDIDEQFVEGNFISLDYGENCGISLKYEIKKPLNPKPR